MPLSCNLCKLSRELTTTERMCPIHGEANWEDYDGFKPR